MDRGTTQENEIPLLLTAPRNQTILRLGRNSDRFVHVSELADRIVTRHATILDSDEYKEKYERVLISLHHNLLPKLTETGLVNYNYDENIVSYRNDAAVDAEWMDADNIDKLLTEVRTEREGDTSAIGMLEDRKSIIEYGRSLAYEANEELFCMYVSDDLLEEVCISHAEDAIERGVDIYFGSQNQNVRDIARRYLPEATLWEPQSNLMREPSSYPKVGRLVLADREKVMLALLDEADVNGVSPETAMIGDGWNNSLVVLVRELLDPRLDHLDYQSEEFRSELPF